MKKKVSCALPGQMTLEEVHPYSCGKGKTIIPKQINEESCRQVLAKKFQTRKRCVAIVDFCWDADVLCIRAFIRRVEHLLLYKNGFSDTKPKTFKVID